ncbi:MAG: peptide ABC transporter substrate-binding protein [Clostridia bacterium]|nr:peptide ABC transporter substrate-binding protein [Clostridia bacterium]
MKKVLAMILCLVMAAGCFVACGKKEENDPHAHTGTEGKGPGDYEFTACIASEPETVDPQLVSSVDGSTYVMHMFEGLMKYNSTGKDVAGNKDVLNCEAVPGMATSYDTSDDGLTYTFHLREDAVWSDGEPVKAADFVYAWQRLVDPNTASDYGYLLDGIVVNAAAIQAEEKEPAELGVEATDDHTFVVHMETACPYFVELCAFASLVPVRKDIVEKYDGADWTKPENMVVNGPFKISEWVHDSYIKMVPNEKYYDYNYIGPGSIKWYLSNDENAILSSYQSGEYAFCENFPTEQIAALKSSGDLTIAPYVGDYYLYLNCEKIPDWRVRAAINLCIDRDFIVENVTMGGQVPATGFVPTGITDNAGKDWTETNPNVLYAWLQEQYPDYDLTSLAYRQELAKKLLADAVADGYDASVTIEYMFNTSESHKKIATAVQNDVKNVLGLNMTLTNQEWNVYTNGLGEHTFGVARLGWIADYNDAITFLELFTNDNSYNYGLWKSDAYTEKIMAAKGLPGGAERDNNMIEAEKIMFSEGGFPMAPLYYYTNLFCIKGYNNAWYTPFGHFLFMYVTKK